MGENYTYSTEKADTKEKYLTTKCCGEPALLHFDLASPFPGKLGSTKMKNLSVSFGFGESHEMILKKIL